MGPHPGTKQHQSPRRSPEPFHHAPEERQYTDALDKMPILSVVLLFRNEFGPVPWIHHGVNRKSELQVLVEKDPTAGTWLLEDDGREMDDSEYSVTSPVNVFAAANFENNSAVLIGLEMNSEMSPTDMAASPEMGGPGGQIRATMAEIYLVDSMGGQVVMKDDPAEEDWKDIKYLNNDSVYSQKLPLFTGKKEVTLAEGWKTDGIKLRIRNKSSRKMTIAAIGLNAARNKGRQA